MPRLDASRVPTTEIDILEESYDRLPDGPLRATLETLSHALRGGQDTFVMTEKDDFTPSEAAKLLGVSRTHLYKILDSGALAHHVVGARDRRIAATDLVAYRARMLATQKRMAEAAAHTDDLDDLVLDEFD
ncbi:MULTISPECIES: helix-turn-helix domain-containing protein [Microbacterium]|uniref:helix-turn-helix domain-containing protein n=1 Tax=Microbacterium TaxID=33882 RepID=UPI0023D9CA6B|nr:MULTISPECIES: helix-turn-helix domain-containing protein [Microbacterium]MDF2047091.1 helix-turn-helix domain-containing protein [Microbacterium sp. Kw_RZR3]MDQ1074806.1 excisionase family DNA binding protein [Microbacterium sp. SORGH_AS_0969]MDQ1115031.1 excisionase family DNA binding protein [Microbacterium testaceum]